MGNRILIAEDEGKLREVLCDYFRSKGDIPVEAENGAKALALAEEETFDAVLLDIMMPELDGLSVCRCLRRKQEVPIIFLTALSAEEDKLLGYELGADDYVTKPFTLSVLYAKTTALIKRSRGTVRTGDHLESGGVTVDLSARRVWAGKREVLLTPKGEEEARRVVLPLMEAERAAFRDLGEGEREALLSLTRRYVGLLWEKMASAG